MARVFDTFGKNPEMPALALFASDGVPDGYGLRHDEYPEPFRGARKPGEMAESMVCLVFARSDRVEILRPSATDLKIREFDVPIEGTSSYAEKLVKGKRC